LARRKALRDGIKVLAAAEKRILKEPVMAFDAP